MVKKPGFGLFDTVLIQILDMGENLLVTVGGVTAKIYRSDTGGYVSWLVRYFVDGKAKSLRATSLKQARSKAKKALESVSSGAAHVEALTPQQMAAVSMAAAKLREVGVPLLEAVTDFVAARKALPAKWTVADAARGFAAYKAREEKNGAAPAPIKFSAAVAKFHERNERRGLSEGYKNDCRKHLKTLGKMLDDSIIQSIRQPELTQCLEASTNGGARRFNNLRCTLNALFGFCQKEGLLPRDRLHEAALIEKKQQRSFETISIYTPQEMRLILANVCEELLPWVVLGGMAGLRVSEIHRLRWENVRLDAGVITLDKAFTKTKKRRVVPMCDALRAWIELIHGEEKKTGLLYDMPYKTFEDHLHKGWMKLVGKDGKLLVPKRKNALRHSYGTYRFSILQDEYRTSAEMGNSPAQLREHYAELCLPADAKAWFAITPSSVRRRKPQLTPGPTGNEKSKKRQRGRGK
jgi:integrase